MANDKDHAVSDLRMDSGASERDSAAVPLKAWVTPKVITSTFEDTAIAPGGGTDGLGLGSSNPS
jgi:hypothetical protein